MGYREGKKKTGIIILVALLLVAISGGAVAFFLLRGESAPNVTATYNAKSVSAKVEATYQLEGQEEPTSLVTKDGHTSINFSNDSADAKDTFITPQDIVLNESAKYVLFTYTFTNTLEDLSTHNKNIRITLQDDSIKQNVTVRYLITSSALTGSLASKRQTMAEASESTLTNAFYIGPQSKVVYQVLVEWDEGSTPNYVCKTSWTTWALN